MIDPLAISGGRALRRLPHRLRHGIRNATSPKGGWPAQLQRYRRRLAWTLVIVLLASIPLGFFALAGLPHLFRNPLVRNVIARETGGGPPGVSSPHFARGLALLTGTSLSTGNAVEVLANGDATFPRLWRDLRLAQRSVTVQMYYAGPGVIADSATQLLAERARAGVDVYFLYDAFGAKDLPARHLDTLRSAGVRVAYEYQPTTMHAKTFVADGAWSVVSTMNFDNRSLAYNNEVALVARDTALGSTMESLFRDDLRLAEEIRLDAFRRRPRAQRLLERAANVIASVL